MDKAEIAEIFEDIALLLEMKDENPFRVRAYRNAARALLNTETPLTELIREKKLTDLEGIGEDLSEKITTLVKTGRLPFYSKLKKSIPKGVLSLREVRGLGAKKIKILYEKLKIDSIVKLKKACEAGKLAKLKGFGKKTEQKLLDALGAQATYAKRMLWWTAAELADPILQSLRKIKGVRQAEIAGSVRRGLETIGDLDFVVSATEPQRVIQWFEKYPEVARVLEKGETKITLRLKQGTQVDVRVVTEKEFPFALLHFTGSKEHNLKLRAAARAKGWSLSEYGLKGKRVSGSEAAIYKAFGYDSIPPELRENQGEFAAAHARKLPHLVTEKDIRGTFHNHTTASDGMSTLTEMAEEGTKMGWEYLGISDHSKSSFQAHGLSIERLEEQITTIRAWNKQKKSLTLFAGTECDILPNGKLDFSDSILEKLDFVIVSVHNALAQDEKTMTQRIIRAVEHPLSTMVGHLTGRLLLKREPYRVNVQKVIDACIANKKIIELNGNPMRLDMDWRLWHKASEKGLLCCVNTDAHHTSHLHFIKAGINSARKGWLEKRHIINTYPLSQIKKLFAK